MTLTDRVEWTHACDRCGYVLVDATDEHPKEWTVTRVDHLGDWDLCETCSDEFSDWFDSGIASRSAK